MKTAQNPYSGYRYPAEIISHGVWLYFRFALSYCDVEEILACPYQKLHPALLDPCLELK